jgi:hypothetical protein
VAAANRAQHYKVERHTGHDRGGIRKIKAACLGDGPDRSLAAYGYVVPRG